MSNYDNNMKGTLGKNQKKEKETHPDIKGKCEIDNKEYWISGWQRESANGSFYSLSFQAKDEQPVKVDDIVDEIPF